MSDNKLLGHLRTAHLASMWLEQLQAATRSYPSEDEAFNEEIHRALGVAQANLLRWRALIAEQNGLIAPLDELIEKNEP